MSQTLRPPSSGHRSKTAPNLGPNDDLAAIWRLPQEILEMVFDLVFAANPYTRYIALYVDMLCVFLGHDHLPFHDEIIDEIMMQTQIDWKADPMLYLAASDYELQVSKRWCRAAAQAFFRNYEVRIYLGDLDRRVLDAIPMDAVKFFRRVLLDMDYCEHWGQERLHEMVCYLLQKLPAIESVRLLSRDMHCYTGLWDSHVVGVFPAWRWLDELVRHKKLQDVSVCEISNDHGQPDAFFNANSDIMDELDAYIQIRLATRICGMGDYKVVARKFGLLVKILCRKPKWKSRKHLNTDMETCSRFTMKQWDIMEALGDMYEDIGNGEATNYFRALHSHSTMYWTWKRREERLANALRAERVKAKNGVIEPEIGRVMTSLEGKINENANRGL